jgi:predicted  nucleic acid-binding Zn-ribbon protein
MQRNRQGFLVSDTHRECTKCGSIFEKTSKMTLCLRCNCERVKSQTPEWKMWQRAKQRARATGREFDITVTDVMIPTHCPILGIELNVNSGKSGAYANSPSLDRKNNAKGYVKGNVWVISQLANRMKGDSSNEELRRFAEWVLASIPAQE